MPIKIMQQSLADGKVVKPVELWPSRTSINCTDEAKAEDVYSSGIKNTKVILRPCCDIKHMLKTLNYEKIEVPRFF